MLSKQNPRIKLLRRLTTRRYREKEGKFLVEGVRFVEEALKSSFLVDMLVYCSEYTNTARGQALLETAAANGTPVLEVDKELFLELAATQTPQGLLAVVQWRPYTLATLREVSQQALLVVVDAVLDPGNLGTIVRAADASGAGAVILLPGTVDILNPKALRASMGSIFHIPVLRDCTAGEVNAFFKQQGIKLIAGVPRGGKPIYESDLTVPCAIIAGSEPRGPGEAILSGVVEKVCIPMPGLAESLNVAVSAAIMLYEAVRQRSFTKGPGLTDKTINGK
ncbi:MAG: 23S rRNA (uridine(2479)-2'-O)-methyltransferase [Pelotomaculum sp. PtaB.Bin104]|nr:MAG: 23S rRNA (uridine(2479)-2'-O)-methyltransferase [Pelotomaculum sp. PtaB.Bin104]